MEDGEVDVMRDGGYVKKLFKEFLRSFLNVETKEPIYRFVSFTTQYFQFLQK